MKVKPEHLAAIRACIEPLDTDERRARYIAGEFERGENVKDLDKRYRWDLLWATRANRAFPIYDYNDSHVDTALRSIVKPLR